MGAKKNSESDESITKVNVNYAKATLNACIVEITKLERRVIALERGLEGVLRRMEEAGQPDDVPGWYGRPE